MPMVGIVDPSHKERKTDQPGRYPRWMSVDDALDVAAAASPKWAPWNYELISALIAEHQERGDRLSVTALTGGCMRGNVIERKMDYIGKLDDLYPSLRGTLIHRALENTHRPGSMAEWRFYTTVDGVEISGSPDLVSYDTIWDWKTTENPPTFDYMYNGHKLQLQFNRFIFNNAKHWDAPPGEDAGNPPLDPMFTRIQHLVIVYLGPKGPKVIETVRSQPAKNGGRNFKVPDIWDDTAVLAELRPRMEGWVKAMGAFPKWPAGLEKYPGWEGPPSWKCPGPPLCYLPNCMAKRYPDGLTWPSR